MDTVVTISSDSVIPFHNRAFSCIGSGRMSLALTWEYQEELEYVQSRLHFTHIRSHGLFCDDMAICRRRSGGLEYVVDAEHGNPLKLWHDLGEPPYPSDDTLQLLRDVAVPLISSRRITPDGDRHMLTFRLCPSAVLFFEWTLCSLTPDEGYQYDDAVLGRAICAVK